MAPRHPNSEREPARAAVGDRLPDGEPASVVRRAPFSDNPQVGARGQRTQQRILDAALRVFGEDGYHQCGIDRITKVAGCSRASFYQYFSDKEDVFRHLAGQVARQLGASIEALDPLTPDADGWARTRAWLVRYADIYERYEPVFQAFQAAAETDEAVAGGSVRTGERHVAALRSRLATTTLPPRQLDPVLTLLLELLPRTLADVRILREAVPSGPAADAYPPDRVYDALADLMHRTLFGRVGVNEHEPAGPRPPLLEFGPVMRNALQAGEEAPELNAAGRRTLKALLEAGRDVFVARGYHRTRVDDVVAAAGVSHGAFYRYFESKDQLAHVLAVRAIRTVSTAFSDVPEISALEGGGARPALRRWLRRYNTSQATEAAMIRVWVEAALDNPALRPDSAAALDWGRRRMSAFLRPRGFGDVDIEALVMVALLGAFGARERPPAVIDAAAHVIEGGFLGR
jgi:AcrR family transcriptional regulator